MCRYLHTARANIVNNERATTDAHFKYSPPLSRLHVAIYISDTQGYVHTVYTNTAGPRVIPRFKYYRAGVRTGVDKCTAAVIPNPRVSRHVFFFLGPPTHKIASNSVSRYRYDRCRNRIFYDC